MAYARARSHREGIIQGRTRRVVVSHVYDHWRIASDRIQHYVMMVVPKKYTPCVSTVTLPFKEKDNATAW